MPKYVLKLRHEMTGTIEVEAPTKERAIQLWEDGDIDRTVELDEQLYGGIPWELVDAHYRIIHIATGKEHAHLTIENEKGEYFFTTANVASTALDAVGTNLNLPD